MKLREIFNTLFASGMDYNMYAKRSDRHLERMSLASQAAVEYLKTLDQDWLARMNRPLRVMCLSENWCGDCANGVPPLAKLAEVMDNWDFRIVARDDFTELVQDYYLTAGRMKIPIVIIADEDGDELARWTERPRQSYEFLAYIQTLQLPKEEYIAKYKAAPELKPPMVVHNVIDEILNLVSKATAMLQILPAKRQ